MQIVSWKKKEKKILQVANSHSVMDLKIIYLTKKIPPNIWTYIKETHSMLGIAVPYCDAKIRMIAPLQLITMLQLNWPQSTPYIFYGISTTA